MFIDQVIHVKLFTYANGLRIVNKNSSTCWFILWWYFFRENGLGYHSFRFCCWRFIQSLHTFPKAISLTNLGLPKSQRAVLWSRSVQFSIWSKTNAMHWSKMAFETLWNTKVAKTISSVRFFNAVEISPLFDYFRISHTNLNGEFYYRPVNFFSVL